MSPFVSRYLPARGMSSSGTPQANKRHNAAGVDSAEDVTSFDGDAKCQFLKERNTHMPFEQTRDATPARRPSCAFIRVN